MPPRRVLPRLTVDNRFFWTSGEDNKLRFLQCQQCETFIHPPYPVCHHCLSDQLEPTEVAGTGTVDLYTVNYQKWRPDLEGPYVIARIAIDGAPGVFLTSNVVNCPVDDVDIGDKVRVIFEHQDDVWFPLFEKTC
ncbi:DNA-binding protein [Mycolicibacter heraklionensis]|uniref:DNA-binding protein n=1 Tax=Mycolicibacter heraklionensis TaxID=512402 RepID=A0ABR5FFA5_9MYCO|nr:OB-fold domain-containing protein [Mycolicibacter heraklionensis]KLO28781.1 DNA-binding protein [Mycolicibacter heraklionensis]